jgi:hypothetical protein
VASLIRNPIDATFSQQIQPSSRKGHAMPEDPDNRSRIKYLLPSIGMATIIGLMLAAFSD